MDRLSRSRSVNQWIKNNFTNYKLVTRKKTSIISHTKADSDKPFKVQEHKRERRTVKHHLTKTGDYDSMVLSDKERFGNECNAPKDGKHYWKDDEGKWKRK